MVSNEAAQATGRPIARQALARVSTHRVALDDAPHHRARMRDSARHGLPGMC
jgi:hypothetical protein